MSENTKLMVPKMKWSKWTGDNLTELQEFWSAELTATGVTFSVDPENGDLLTSAPFFSPWNVPTSVGNWASRAWYSTPEEYLMSTYTEIPETGLMPAE